MNQYGFVVLPGHKRSGAIWSLETLELGIASHDPSYKENTGQSTE